MTGTDALRAAIPRLAPSDALRKFAARGGFYSSPSS